MKLDENDHLTYQLFAASKKSSVKKTRLWGWAFTTGTFLVLGLLFFQQKNELLARYFLVLSGLSLILYPFYSRWRYKQHYRKHVRDTFKNAADGNSTIEIGEDVIVTRDDNGTELKFNTDQIEVINEIRDYYFIKIKSGLSLILPKSKLEDPEDIKRKIDMLANNRGVSHDVDLNWHWK